MQKTELEQVGWYKPQLDESPYGRLVGFWGGPKDGDVEYLGYVTTDVYRAVTMPPMSAVVAHFAEHVATIPVTTHVYDLRLYSKGGPPYFYTTYYMLMDDEVVEFVTQRVNPEHTEQYRYIYREG